MIAQRSHNFNLPTTTVTAEQVAVARADERLDAEQGAALMRKMDEDHFAEGRAWALAGRGFDAARLLTRAHRAGYRSVCKNFVAATEVGA